MSRPDAGELAAVFAGGVLGTLARAALAQSSAAEPGAWPWATFAVNVAGAAIIGAIVTRAHARVSLAHYRRTLLGTAFCGGLTTFSALQLELLRMLDRGRLGLALAYAGTSVACGLAAVALASALARRGVPAPR